MKFSQKESILKPVRSMTKSIRKMVEDNLASNNAMYFKSEGEVVITFDGPGLYKPMIVSEFSDESVAVVRCMEINGVSLYDVYSGTISVDMYKLKEPYTYEIQLFENLYTGTAIEKTSIGSFKHYDEASETGEPAKSGYQFPEFIENLQETLNSKYGEDFMTFPDAEEEEEEEAKQSDKAAAVYKFLLSILESVPKEEFKKEESKSKEEGTFAIRVDKLTIEQLKSILSNEHVVASENVFVSSELDSSELTKLLSE